MKICFICDEYPPGPHGGIGTFIQVLGRGLVNAGHEVRVVGAYRSDYPAADYEEDQGVRVWRLRMPHYRLGWMTGRIQLFRHVAAWAKRGELEIVETPDYQGWAAFWPSLSVPVITRLHGSATYFAAEMGQTVRRSMRFLERRSLHRSDAWCSVSHYTAEKTRQLFQLRQPPRAILHNPVETKPVVAFDQRSGVNVVFTGTLTAKKGILPLVQSWPHVLQSMPQARLHIYGKDGKHNGSSMQEYLISQLTPAQLKTVEFHGHQPRDSVFAALSTALVAVFPSYAEAFAIAPLEAMACGCPTIYSERGSGPELIEHEVNGLLVNPDQPESIAAATLRLLKNTQFAEQLGAAGFRTIRDRFTLNHIIPENERFYLDCCEQWRGSSIAAQPSHS